MTTDPPSDSDLVMVFTSDADQATPADQFLRERGDAVRRPRSRPARRLVLAPLLAATLIVALAVGIAVIRSTTGGSTGPNDDATAPITVSGSSVPYAGLVPWANAVTDPAQPGVIDVYADGDSIHTKAFLCGLPTERVHVVETATSVTVSILGFARPFRGMCAGVGHTPQLQQVVLTAPLGARTLIDAATGTSHRVLDPASVPTVGALPTGFHALPITWDESTGLTRRTYFDTPTRTLRTRIINLTVAAPAALSAAAPPEGSVIGTTPINGIPSTIRHYADQYQYFITIDWIVSAESQLELEVSYPPTIPPTVVTVIAIAKSVR